MDFTEAYADTCSTVGLAAREGNVKVLRKLLKKGRSVDVADNRGWMPIHEAAYHNSVECLQMLINAVVLPYPQGIGPKMSTDTKIHGCSSSSAVCPEDRKTSYTHIQKIHLKTTLR